MIAIVTHRQADFDALGAVVAAHLLHPDAVPVVEDGSAAVESFLAVHRDALGIRTGAEIDWAQVRGLICVDVQDPARFGGVPRLAPEWSLRIIDHHPDNGQALGERQIEPVGSATTLVVEQLQAQGIVPGALEATAIALGLYSDTGGFLYPGATARDAAAFAWVMGHGFNADVLRQYVHAEVPDSVRDVLEALLAGTRAVSPAGHAGAAAALHFPAYVADAAVAVEHWAKVTGKALAVAALQMDAHVHLIGRASQPGLDLVEAWRDLGAKGHGQACYARIKDADAESVLAAALQRLEQTLPPAPTARTVMTTPVFRVAPELSVVEAADLLTTWGHSVLPVAGPGGEVHGLIGRAETDKAMRHGLSSVPVKGVMRAATVIPATTPQADLPGLLAQAERHRLLVTDQGRLVGIIAGTDLVKRLYGTPLGLAADRPSADALVARLAQRLAPAVMAMLRQVGAVAAETGVGVYWVGGSVRDLLLERDAPPDIDLVVDGDGVSLARRWAAASGLDVQVHERFGTAKLRTPVGPVDVASSRREYYPHPGAQPEVQFCPIAHDLARRDFTVNALAIRLDPPHFGQLLDFFGGWQDLLARQIRVLHPLSYLEDPSRIWRAVRFEQKLGFQLAGADLEQIQATMANSSFEHYANHRIAQEMRLLWSEGLPAARSLERLGELGALRPFGIEAVAVTAARFQAYDDARIGLSAPADERWLGYLALLLADRPEAQRRQLLKMMKLGVGERERIESAWQLMVQPVPEGPLALYDWGIKASELSLACAFAVATPEGQARIRLFWGQLRTIRAGLDGQALAAMGFQPGPLFGKVLTAVLRAKIAGTVTTIEDEKRLATRMIAEETHAD